MYLGPYEICFIFLKFILLLVIELILLSSPEVDGVVPPNQYVSMTTWIILLDKTKTIG